jgi:hypothetical protein
MGTGGGVVGAAELFDADFAIKANPAPPARTMASKTVFMRRFRRMMFLL